jgi:hypothetical protein
MTPTISDMRTRYVVFGLRGAAEEWRRSRGLSPRDVIHVSTTNAHAVRGLSGPFEVITLESWSQASQRVREEVERDLAIAALTQPAAT